MNMENFLEHQTGLFASNEQKEHSTTTSRTELPLKILRTLRILRDANVSLERKLNHFSTVPDEYIEYWNRYQVLVSMDKDELVGINLGGLMVRIVNIIPFLESCQHYDIKLGSINLGGTDVQMDNLLEALEKYENSIASTKKLYLGGCSISCFKKIKQLAKVLKLCTALTILDLRYNDLNDLDIEEIAPMLSKSIKVLHLEGNQIQCNGAKAISDNMLSTQSASIEELYLGANNIDPNGAHHIANGLISNLSLTKLYLEGNKIGDDGAKAFTVVLTDQTNRRCTALQHLYVSNNGLGKDVAIELGRAVNHNSMIDGLF